METLEFGTLKFKDEREYYIALGSFCNNKAFSISYEPNKSTGSYADAYRMRKLSTAQDLIAPIENAIRTGNRINSNSYVEALIKKHNFIQNGKLIYGSLENVIKTVPTKYVADFIKSYQNSASIDNKSVVVYEMENIKTTAKSLKKVAIPKASSKASKLTIGAKKSKTKHDYLKESIKNIDIGERGEKLVYEQEKKKLINALKSGKKINIKECLKWVAIEDDSAGYDILSLDINTMQPMYIEVKTTTYSKSTPFYMSQGEIDFSKKNASNYHLYRIYNLKNDVAEYFELTGDISKSTKVQIDAVSYLVTIK